VEEYPGYDEQAYYCPRRNKMFVYKKARDGYWYSFDGVNVYKLNYTKFTMAWWRELIVVLSM
jgi:hypothetical protein